MVLAADKEGAIHAISGVVVEAAVEVEAALGPVEKAARSISPVAQVESVLVAAVAGRDIVPEKFREVREAPVSSA